VIELILNGAESFFLPGGPHGVLLVHGFTGSPSEMVLLGGALHHQGFTVLCMRMAGHGTTPEDMEHMNWENWFDSVMDGYSLLEGCCERISVVGHSMGGLMAMLLSTRAEIYKIVSLAAPIFIADERELRLLPPREQSQGQFVPKRRKRLPGIPGICNVAYRRMPLVSVHELLNCIRYVRGQLSQVQRPLLIMQSHKDHTVQPQSAEYIYENTASQEKRIEWLEESGHLLPVDSERETVFAKTAEFLSAAEGETNERE
jgi:carboxylesterase